MILVCMSVSIDARAQEVGGGDLTFTPKNALPVIFSHEKHVNRKDLKCPDCHYQYFEMAKGSSEMGMAKITKGEFCGRCHNGRLSFGVKDRKNCSRCHR